MSLLTVEDLQVKINHQLICDGLSFAVQPGDCWGILGANGCGKTTLLHTLAGFRAPIHGQLFLQGQNFLTYSLKEAAQKKGILLQNTTFTFPQTVFDYCLAGRHPHLALFKTETAEDHRIVQECLLEMDLLHLRDQLVQTLSGGEQRRLAIATLFTQQPLLYFLDEPTNHLDVKHQINILNYARERVALFGGATIMAIHDINLAQRFCNKFLMLFEEGKYLLGDALLTEENLSRLYNHPIKLIKAEGKNIWVAN